MARILRQFAQKLKKSKFARSVIVLSSGTALAQVINAAISPILTRLYSPGDLGTFAIFASALNWMLYAVALRLEHAIPLAETDEEASNVVGAGIISIATVTIITSPLLLLLPHIFHGESQTRILWLLPFALGFAGSYQLVSFWALREKA